MQEFLLLDEQMSLSNEGQGKEMSVDESNTEFSVLLEGIGCQVVWSLLMIIMSNN